MTVSFPTLVNPFYVVLLYKEPEPPKLFHDIHYWSTVESEAGSWVDNPHQAMIFTSLHSANRIAKANVAYVVVIADKEDYKQYRPREFVNE